MTEFQAQDNAGFFNPEDQKIPEGIPQPMLWRVLLMPVQPASRSKGTHGKSIHLPAQTQDNDSYLNYIGRVAAMGPLAGKSERYQNPAYVVPKEMLREYHNSLMEGEDFARFEQRVADVNTEPRWLWDIKVGDWVCYGRYSGQRIEFQGVKFILANDDEILAKISGPDGFRAYI